MALGERTPTPNYINPVTMSTIIIAVGATSSAIAFFFLCTKLYAALRIFHSVKLDDYTNIVAFLFTLANVGLLLNARKDARHAWDLSNAEFTRFHIKVMFVGAMVGALGLSFAKLSILFLLYRVFSSCRGLRFAIYFGIAWTILICATSLVMTLVLCAPRSPDSSSSPWWINRCTRFEIWSIVRGASSVLLDFYILCLPVPTVWNLHLGIKKKIGVLGIFMTGFIACTLSILGLYYKVLLWKRPDKLWSTEKVFLLNTVESYVAIMIVCMPACASVFRDISSKFNLLQLIKSLSGTKLSTGEKTSSPAKYKKTHLAVDDANNGNDRHKRLKGPLSLTTFQTFSTDEESRILGTENAGTVGGKKLEVSSSVKAVGSE